MCQKGVGVRETRPAGGDVWGWRSGRLPLGEALRSPLEGCEGTSCGHIWR